MATTKKAPAAGAKKSTRKNNGDKNKGQIKEKKLDPKKVGDEQIRPGGEGRKDKEPKSFGPHVVQRTSDGAVVPTKTFERESREGQNSIGGHGGQRDGNGSYT